MTIELQEKAPKLVLENCGGCMTFKKTIKFPKVYL